MKVLLCNSFQKFIICDQLNLESVQRNCLFTQKTCVCFAVYIYVDVFLLKILSLLRCSYCSEVYIELFHRWGWKRVALLAADGQNFPEYNSFLKDLFLSHSVSVAYDRKMPRQATFSEAGKVRSCP